MKVFEAIAAEVTRQRVGVVFALQSEEILRFSVQLSQLGVRIIKPRHEAGSIRLGNSS